MSSAERSLAGHWDQLKAKIKEHWSHITDEDLAKVEGQYEQLVNVIQQKTGVARQQISRVVDELAEVCGITLEQAKEAARDYINQANQAAQQSAGQVQQKAREGYVQGREIVRSRPAESVAVAFGTGLLVGVIVGLVVRSR